MEAQSQTLVSSPLVLMPFPSKLYTPEAEPLEIPVTLAPRYCEVCDSEQTFLADRELPEGRVAACSRCGDERFVPFSRTTVAVEVCA